MRCAGSKARPTGRGALDAALDALGRALIELGEAQARSWNARSTRWPSTGRAGGGGRAAVRDPRAGAQARRPARRSGRSPRRASGAAGALDAGAANLAALTSAVPRPRSICDAAARSPLAPGRCAAKAARRRDGGRACSAEDGTRGLRDQIAGRGGARGAGRGDLQVATNPGAPARSAEPDRLGGRAVALPAGAQGLPHGGQPRASR
jgi:hypothetical protein